MSTTRTYQRLRAEPVKTTVEGLEALTTGMARKIWQKIALLPHADDQAQLPGTTPAL